MTSRFTPTKSQMIFHAEKVGDGCGAEDPSEQEAEEARGVRMGFNQLLDVFSQH